MPLVNRMRVDLSTLKKELDERDRIALAGAAERIKKAGLSLKEFGDSFIRASKIYRSSGPDFKMLTESLKRK